jgi:hypothetical protein
MKKITLLLSFFLLISGFVSSQEVIRVQACTDTLISRQVDSLKTLYAKDGFEVLKEASITMESEYEMPVIVPLQERSHYQIVFIGDITSKLYELRMYDYDEKLVTYQKKMWGDIDGNIISFPFIPKFSEFYMIKPVQVNKDKKKKKKLCGYVMLLAKMK